MNKIQNQSTTSGLRPHFSISFIYHCHHALCSVKRLCVLMLINLMARLTIPNRCFILCPVRSRLLSQMITRSPYLMNCYAISFLSITAIFLRISLSSSSSRCECLVIKMDRNVNQLRITAVSILL